MHNLYRDLYSTLTFGSSHKTAACRARDEHLRPQTDETDFLGEKDICVGKPSSRTKVWVGRLVLVPLALASGTVAISSCIGEAAAKLYVEPFVPKENGRKDAGGRY
ncbi:MAG: hypothetical protein OEY05_05445 [Paracoccaceae bacterium]|nr:hypothetical protein [Paracoccaceae bacterium]